MVVKCIKFRSSFLETQEISRKLLVIILSYVIVLKTIQFIVLRIENI